MKTALFNGTCIVCKFVCMSLVDYMPTNVLVCTAVIVNKVESTTLPIVLITRAISCNLLAEWVREGELEERKGGK